MNEINLKNSVEFMRLTNWIREKLPQSYFAGIIASYTINAVMIGFFLFPTLSTMIGWWAALFVASIGTIVIQFFRGLIVFTDLLFAESGENSKHLVKVVALVMTIVGVFELWHLLSGFEGEVSNGQLIGVFVFGSSIIVGGWMMEINFIEQTKKFIFGTAQLDKQRPDFLLESYQEKQPNHYQRRTPDQSGEYEAPWQNSYQDDTQSKTGVRPITPQRYRGIEPSEIAEFDAQYIPDKALEEQLAAHYRESPQEPLEGDTANFSQNGHHP